MVLFNCSTKEWLQRNNPTETVDWKHLRKMLTSHLGGQINQRMAVLSQRAIFLASATSSFFQGQLKQKNTNADNSHYITFYFLRATRVEIMAEFFPA